ncbi:MAG: response regulator [Candidatus Eremiobacteraeota bacterium]|nr:response regulator [Candidatus Eremiobacteraeota bacterium]
MAARILVLDDNATNRELMSYLLRSYGYGAEGVADGFAALDALRAAAYDLVLVDMLMPGMDGYEFAQRFRSDASMRRVPLVAVTALAMPGDRERILSSGFDGYISKPIDPPSFVTTVERYLSDDLRVDSGPRISSANGEQSSAREGHGPVILAVDDVPENLDFVRAALAPFGYRVVDANSVEEAILMLEHAHPAIVLCDLHMPRRDGFELLEYVRGHAAQPFVFVSSTGWNAEDRHRGLSEGAAKFLRRPIEPERLRAEIEETLGG